MIYWAWRQGLKFQIETGHSSEVTRGLRKGSPVELHLRQSQAIGKAYAKAPGLVSCV